uniref:Cyclic nucleotide-binding domain-containing protein n=1 Tax=Zooxanthella nutricula TaxID=1333877 RepID=A0A7S2L5W1_9DINO
MVEGQEVYEVPIGGGDQPGGDVKLKVQIRPSKADGGQATDDGALQSSEEGQSGSTVKKLQTALTMRSYLDNHDVLRQMQELLQEMVTHRPDDPIEYMIQRLEQVCLDSQGVELDLLDAAAPAAPAAADADKGKAKTGDVGDSEEEEDDDDAPDLPLPPPPQVGRKRQSVSEEAYGSYNQRKAYEAKVIAKDEGQKGRIREVMKQCWMFQSHTPENVNAIIDAMDEKRVSKGEKLINQGDYGEVMWIIESGALECFKTLDGQEKLVKTCQRGDVFGELALLYGCPRAASVVSSEECVLWELDRETFKAICFEAAQAAPLPQYEGFVAPGAAGEAGAEAPGGEAAKRGCAAARQSTPSVCAISSICA